MVDKTVSLFPHPWHRIREHLLRHIPQEDEVGNSVTKGISVLRSAVSWYITDMTLKLSQDLVDALISSGTGELEVVSPTGNRKFYVVDEVIHRQAMKALRLQQDHAAIANGITQMEAGEGTSLDEAFDGIRATLSLPQRQK